MGARRLEFQVFLLTILAKRADIVTAGGPKVAPAIDMALLEAIRCTPADLIDSAIQTPSEEGPQYRRRRHDYLDSFDAWSKVRPPLTGGIEAAAKTQLIGK